MKSLRTLFLLLLSTCAPLSYAAEETYSVGAGSLEEALELYGSLTDQTVENCIWGMLRPFNLEGEATRDKQKAIAEIEAQFETQQVRLISIAEKRQVAVWKNPNAINQVFVGDLLKFYALLTGKRVDVVQSIQFWINPPPGGIGAAENPVAWIEQALIQHGARIFSVDNTHIVVSWDKVKK